MAAIVSDEKIPNNVNLAGDRRLQRALEAWQPKFIDWWKEMGPVGFQAHDVYLRTAVSVEASGWAHFDYVKMPEYRWGIFLEPKDPARTIGFGAEVSERGSGQVELEPGPGPRGVQERLDEPRAPPDLSMRGQQPPLQTLVSEAERLQLALDAAELQLERRERRA